MCFGLNHKMCWFDISTDVNQTIMFYATDNNYVSTDKLM